MEYLALDLGSTVGWAGRMGKAYYVGEEVFAQRDLGDRLDAFGSWLYQHLPETALIVEEPYVRQITAARALYQMAGIARGLVVVHARLNLYPTFSLIAHQTAKLAVTGSGNATKLQVLAGIGRLLPGVEIPGEHAADAAACLLAWERREKSAKMMKGAKWR